MQKLSQSDPNRRIYIYIYREREGERDIYIYIMMVMYFPLILLIFGIKSDFYGFPSPWDHFNPVRIGNSLKLQQKLRKFIEYCPGNEPQTFGKMDFKTFVKNLTFLMGLGGTVQGKMSVMTMGSFHVFIKRMTHQESWLIINS